MGIEKTRRFVYLALFSAMAIVLSIIESIYIGPVFFMVRIGLANIVARLLALILVECRVRLITSNTRWSLSSRQVGLDIIRYTLPLLPGSLCWWLTGSSDRLFIKYFLGLDVNGIYAVAIRFTSIISTLAIIFYQAWQETAILQYNSPDRDRFFSKMFNSYIFALAGILIGYAFMLKANYNWLVAPEYRESLMYIYPMGLSAVIFALAAFFDMGYQCAKDTPRTLPSIVLAAAVNVALNFALIKPLGVYGVIITQLVTYLVLFFYRWHDMRRYFILKIDRRCIIPVVVMLLWAIPFYYSPNVLFDIVFMAIALGCIVWACGKELRELLLSKFTKTHDSIK